MVDLLKKKVSISDPYILLFLYPSFHFIVDLKQPIDYSEGVIYKGTVTDSLIKKLDLITSGRYILLSEFADITLQKPSDYISVFFPSLEDKSEQYNNYELDAFIPMFKQYLILQKKPPVLKEEETGTFQLFRSLIGSKVDLEKEYFHLLETMSPKVISSSVLTFLLKVKDQNFNNCSPSYKKLLNSAYLKFGSKIKPAIKQYIESEQKPEIALWLLLDTLNG